MSIYSIYIINQISLIPTTTVNQVQKKICLISKHFKQEQIVLLLHSNTIFYAMLIIIFFENIAFTVA